MAQARGVRVEVWFQDEARVGQKNTLTRVWGQTGSRLAAPKDLGFASAYLFGAVCPSQGKAAALIMPICKTAAMNHHLCEISSQVAADAHAVVILDGASWHNSHGLMVPSNITLLVPHLLRRPAGDETRGRLMVAWPSATGTEVGCSMVRESPSVSRTRNAGAPRSAPWADNGSGARFLEFF